MLNEAAKKWVAALKYGGYKQGTANLHVAIKDGPDKFCCLGIACKLYVEEHGEGSLKVVTDKFSEEVGYGIVTYEGDEQCMPPKVMAWLGLRDELGGYGDKSDEASRLAALNDKSQPFMDIARVIESEPEGLFVKE